jgi:hypothetical protein
MPLTLQPTFVHCDNADGTTDSFCKQCLVAVARRVWEADLDIAEQEHVCDPGRLEYLRILPDSPLRRKLMNGTR